VRCIWCLTLSLLPSVGCCQASWWNIQEIADPFRTQSGTLPIMTGMLMTPTIGQLWRNGNVASPETRNSNRIQPPFPEICPEPLRNVLRNSGSFLRPLPPMELGKLLAMIFTFKLNFSILFLWWEWKKW